MRIPLEDLGKVRIAALDVDPQVRVSVLVKDDYIGRSVEWCTVSSAGGGGWSGLHTRGRLVNPTCVHVIRGEAKSIEPLLELF